MDEKPYANFFLKFSTRGRGCKLTEKVNLFEEGGEIVVRPLALPTQHSSELIGQ